jgi:hypothetical protein
LALEKIGSAMDRVLAGLTSVERKLEIEAVDVATAVARKLANELISREPLTEIAALATRCLTDMRSAPHVAVRVWRANGKHLGKLDDLLLYTRIRMVLVAADGVAGSDCPFWLEPQHPFRGRQISDGRWQLSFGGGGKGIVTRQGSTNDLRFGGAGRLLIGRVLAGGDAIYVGGEVGANAGFPKDAMGDRSNLVVGIDVVTPVVYRRTYTNAYLEFEAGWLGHANEQNWSDFDHGIHIGVAIGARALRRRFVFPGAAIGVSYERLFLDGDDLRSIKIGARVAFDLDL